MLSKSMRKVLDLIQKTGDRCVVLDAETDNAFVVMGLDDYEKAVSFPGFEEVDITVDNLEEANQDIAMWREENKEDVDVEGEDLAEISEKDEEENQPEDDRFYIEPVE